MFHENEHMDKLNQARTKTWGCCRIQSVIGTTTKYSTRHCHRQGIKTVLLVTMRTVRSASQTNRISRGLYQLYTLLLGT